MARTERSVSEADVRSGLFIGYHDGLTQLALRWTLASVGKDRDSLRASMKPLAFAPPLTGMEPVGFEPAFPP